MILIVGLLGYYRVKSLIAKLRDAYSDEYVKKQARTYTQQKTIIHPKREKTTRSLVFLSIDITRNYPEGVLKK